MRFSEEYFLYSAKASAAFHLNSIATQPLSKYISYLETWGPQAVPRSPFELCTWEIPARWSFSFPSLSAYYDGNYTSEMFVSEEYRLSFRRPIAISYHSYIFQHVTSLFLFRFIPLTRGSKFLTLALRISLSI